MQSKSRRLALVGPECVACGCCLQACPLGAITVCNGATARVDEARCVGCGNCSVACPASVITIKAREPMAGDGGQ